MSKEAIQKLTKYQGDIKSKLESKDLPAKHVNREKNYRQFLEREYKSVSAKIEALRMAGDKK
jgi:hypothetical protein